jgi:small conductance mechanosensitive channel
MLLAQTLSQLDFRNPAFERNLINLSFQMLKALAILLTTRWVANAVRHVAQRLLKYAEPTLQKFLLQVSGILVWVVGSVAALNSLGIQTTTIVAVIGAAGLAIGLALQNSLSHFAAGVLLVSFRPFEVGDFVEGATVSGTVDSIGLFSTAIVTPDNVRITVPNGNLFSSNLKNQTVMGTRRVDLLIDIGDRTIEPTIEQFLSLTKRHPLILRDPKPTCHVDSIPPTGTMLYLRPWCAANHYEQVKSDMLKLVKESLQADAPPPASS